MKNNKKLKILFVPAWYPTKENPVNGIFIKEHAKAASLYNDVVILYSEKTEKKIKGSYQIVSDAEENGIRTVRVKYRKIFPETSYFVYLWSIFRAFQKLKEDWKPDIIHAHVYWAGVPAVILGKMYKTPVIITEHCSVFPRHLLSFLERKKARFAMNHAQLILPVSKNLQKHIKSYNIHNKFQIVPNVVDVNLFHPSLNEDKNLRKDLKKKQILFVGLLVPVKGIPYLLKAIKKIRNKRQDFVLDIIGDGPKQSRYKLLAEKLNIQDIVNFLGRKTKEDIAEFMKNSDFFVLPSLWENLPCVLIEAMASGLPIIATRVGGVPEMINRKRGILVPSKNVDVLEKAINYMLDHYQKYSSQEIAQYAISHYSYKSVGETLSKIYTNLLFEKNHETHKNL